MIAASNKNLREAVKEGAFRQDLYFRLNVIQIVLPPMRHRPEDLMPLARFFIEHYNRKFRRAIEGISPEAEQLLLSHDWPGNVCELRNAVERAIILEESTYITAASPPMAITRPDGSSPAAALHNEMPAEGLSLEDSERMLVARALEKPAATRPRPPACCASPAIRCATG